VIPLHVWQDRLVPMLSRVEAGRLRRVCKALKTMLDGCHMDLGPLHARNVEAALRCYPKAESMNLMLAEPLTWSFDLSSMVQVLREHRGTLQRVTATGRGAEDLLSTAVEAGALPELRYYDLNLANPRHRQLLSAGLLPKVEELKVVSGDLSAEDQIATDEQHLRRLEHLRSISFKAQYSQNPAVPAFIPPSLRMLRVSISPAACLESLLRVLPSVLQASGARLEEFKVGEIRELSIEGGDALAQVLRTCSPSLRSACILPSKGAEDTSWVANVAPGLVSCCDRLERLDVSWPLLESLPPTCPSFARLTSLRIRGTRLGFGAPLWGLMARGLLPGLADLSLSGRSGIYWPPDKGADGRWPLSRAFEAVAGTLRRLTLTTLRVSSPPLYDDERAFVDLGAAIGQLRRLSYLSLRLSPDGCSYQAVGQGLAASGECPPLFELHFGGLTTNAHVLTHEPSLVVPSVRDLAISGTFGEEGVLVLCCALVRMGYGHRFTCLMFGMFEEPPFPRPQQLQNVRLRRCLLTILQKLGRMNACYTFQETAALVGSGEMEW
jgi:hypothetical protein